ncbi:MAG: ferritin-like domain-containing protein [Firmicutes bacterium]|nr:ferritin-like domain-containing protein [Bacillota bacterium]
MYPYNLDESEKSPDKSLTAQNINYDEKLAELLIMAMEYEAEDAAKYKTLSSLSQKEDDIEILRSMFLDEVRHSKLLGEIYEKMFGVVPQIQPKEYVFDGNNLADEYNKNIVSEVESARFYRDLSNMFTDQSILNTINSMLNDEQNHSVLNVYLFHNNH